MCTTTTYIILLRVVDADMKSPMECSGDIAVNRRLRSGPKKRKVESSASEFARICVTTCYSHCHCRSFPLRGSRNVINVIRSTVCILSLFPARRQRFDRRRRSHHLRTVKITMKWILKIKTPHKRKPSVIRKHYEIRLCWFGAGWARKKSTKIKRKLSIR